MNIPIQGLWTLSNMLSISRMIAAPFIYVLITSDYPRSWVYVLALIAYVSDLLDGYVARARNEITEWGKILDPLADKLFVASTCLALMTTDHLSIWYIAVVIGRDVLIVLAGLVFANKAQVVPPSTFIGKATVFWIGLVLLGAFFQVESNIMAALYTISTGLLALSLFHYGKRMFISMRNS